ncbi:hypothetical protein Tcan_18587 [Toxocara canis]|uniref:Uncharacterized protein n=1 Tax=Toxocara canis TaxID=6265 RepID=A0A0B2V8W5_TOXCA|nr:hypothetical protein Tcan_18587 [Toxocara canis]
MDEDDYNAIETADFLGNEEPLSYGEDGHMELAVCAIDELNNLERRARKRPMGIENSDPIVSRFRDTSEQ